MKAALRKSPISENKCFEVYRLQDQYFDPYWHFHPEFQLFTVIKGSGTRFIGDNVSSFKDGEVVFTGPNLPHLWRSDPEYFDGNGDLSIDGLVIYFHESLMTEGFLQKEETIQLRQLLQRSERGIKIDGENAERIRSKMITLSEATDFERILKLLDILFDFSLIKDYKLLSSPGYINSLKESDSKRMRAVHAYVMKHFKETISLEQVAEVANMTPAAFSRHFKRHANKTFSNFLSEIRVGYACKLLVDKHKNVSQACFDSGFNTLSNFNKQFKTITKMSPLKYKRIYKESKSKIY
ncbi:MAG: AraC family transcriptional regulator [Cyclobacteriaceae bacterium]